MTTPVQRVAIAISLFSGNAVYAAAPVVMIEKVTRVDNDRVRVEGWARALESPCSWIGMNVKLMRLDLNGAVGSLHAETPPGFQTTIVRTSSQECSPPSGNIGWEAVLNAPSTEAGGPQGYLIEADGDYYGQHTIATSRFARRTLAPVDGLSGLDVILRFQGRMDGLSRDGLYESYPTVMNEGGTYKMWFVGPNDVIHYARNESPWPTSGSHWQVLRDNGSYSSGPFKELLGHGTGSDSGLTSDPSVVHPPGMDYYMFYEGLPAGDCSFQNSLCYNRIFGAKSSDGINWQKMNPDGNTYVAPFGAMTHPLICPAAPLAYASWMGPMWSYFCSLYKTAFDFGAGQSSVIYKDQKFIQFHTDYFDPYQFGRGGLGKRESTDGWSWFTGGAHSWTPTSNPPGEVSWDFKYHSPSARYFGAVAKFGPRGPDPNVGEDQKGSIGLTHGTAGVITGPNDNPILVGFTPAIDVPMAVLNPNPVQQSINNGGLLGNPQGLIDGDFTAFYFGAGCGMNQDRRCANGSFGSFSWDIHAVEIRLYAVP
jgi:hypothetical protein